MRRRRHHPLLNNINPFSLLVSRRPLQSRSAAFSLRPPRHSPLTHRAPSSTKVWRVTPPRRATSIDSGSNGHSWGSWGSPQPTSQPTQPTYFHHRLAPPPCLVSATSVALHTLTVFTLPAIVERFSRGRLASEPYATTFQPAALVPQSHEARLVTCLEPPRICSGTSLLPYSVNERVDRISLVTYHELVLPTQPIARPI